MMKNPANMLKQAQQIQSQMQQVQKHLADCEVTGQAGGGMVQITLNGHGEMKRAQIQKEAISEDDIEMVEDLIVTAYNNAKTKMDALVSEETQKAMNGFQLPAGVKLPW